MMIPGRVRRKRAMLGEFVVVVLGVLVALTLEQVVLDWQERERARATLAAMNEELSDYVTVFQIRTEVSACVDRKLDELEAFLAGPEPAGGIEGIGRTPYYFSSRSGWSAGGPDLLARYRGPQVARLYGEVYQGMAEFAQMAQQDQGHWATISTLGTRAGPIESNHRWRIGEAIAGARNSNRLMSAIADQMRARIQSLEIPEPAALVTDLESRPICKPLVIGD